jgi:site-specific recombinase XerD
MSSPVSGVNRGSGKPGKWPGGYVRHGKRGDCYVIERWIDGRRYHVSTKCRTLRAAMKALEDFEADPPNYKPERAKQFKRTREVTITADLILEYRAWMLTRDEPATNDHTKKHVACLRDWLVFFAGRPIREVRLSEISEHLAAGDKGSPFRNRAMRIQALKSFCSWLRKVRYLLERQHDPTIDLEAPRVRAAKDVRQVAIEPERIMRVLPLLPEETRDVMILRLGTGWHAMECRRFAAGGVIRRTPGKFIHLMTENGPERIPLLAVLQVRQKVGVETNTPIIYEEHLAAAERIRERKSIPSQSTMGRHTRDACDKAGVPRFWNWHIRHSVVSHAVESGADLEHASVFVDHFGIDTTRRHYKQIALPKKAVPVLRVVDGGKG